MGFSGTTTYGATDDLGHNAVENPVHVRDLHATMLHLLGLDHQRLTLKHQGLGPNLPTLNRLESSREYLRVLDKM